jgi:hypothetical protein
MRNQIGIGAGMSQPNQYMPGTVPNDFDARRQFLNKSGGGQHQRIKGNYLVDLPFGRGKLIGRNSSSVLDKFIGGWKLAGLGNMSLGNTWSLPTGNWVFTGEPVVQYGYNVPVMDCTASTLTAPNKCYPGYLFYNGYIPTNKINSVDANGNPNGIMGVPADYKPVQVPLIPWGSTTLPLNAPANTNVASYWDTNNVWIPMKDGSAPQMTSYAPGLHPWRNQGRHGIARTWITDASLFKTIRFTESVNMRLNVDFFNVLNAPGNANGSPASTGVISARSSTNSPRVLQLSIRVSW